MCERTVLPLDAAVAMAEQTEREDPLGMIRRLAVDALTQLANDPRRQAVFEILFHKCELVGEVAERAAARATDSSQCLFSVERLFAEAIAKGQLCADADPAIAAHMMHAYIIGLMREWVLQPKAYDLAGAAPAMVDAMLAGLRANAPRRAAILERAGSESIS